jgi:hypothetical protein
MAERRGPVEAAVARDLRQLPPELRRSGLATATLTLAKRLDDPETTDRDAAGLLREVRASLLELRKMAPPAPKSSRVDEIKAKREARRGA